MWRFTLSAICAAGAGFATAAPAGAQDDVFFDRTPEECVVASRIRSTRIVDDQTILFYMRGGNVVYRNDLPRRCPRLKAAGTFSYELRSGRLCDIEWITVIERMGAFRQPGANCPLGQFAPITPEEAADVVAGPEAARRANESVEIESVEIEAIELPDDTADAESSPDADDAAD